MLVNQSTIHDGWIGLAADRVHHRLRMFRQIKLRKGEPELRVLPARFSGLDVAIDIGANQGMYSEVLSRMARTVVTVEPNVHCADYLRRVLPRNCSVVQKAASNRAGEAVLRIPCYGRRFRESRGTIEPGNRLGGGAAIEEQRVELATLDDIVAGLSLGSRRIGFIKIDVEGHEHSVLVGAEGVIRAHRPVLLVETELQHGAPVAQIFSMMAGWGYGGHVLVGKALVEMGADAFLHEQQQGGRVVNNVFFIPGADA